MFVLQKEWDMHPNHLYVKAFKAGLPGFAVHPSNTIAGTISNRTNALNTSNSVAKAESNHLTQSLNNYISHKLEDKAYNSSFLNSTSLDSQTATTEFIEALQSMTDYDLQNINYLNVNDSFFNSSSTPYQSFGHAQSSNYLQESLLNMVDVIDSNPKAFIQLEKSAKKVLQSFGLPTSQNNAADLINGMSDVLHIQTGNIGHLIDLRV